MDGRENMKGTQETTRECVSYFELQERFELFIFFVLKFGFFRNVFHRFKLIIFKYRYFDIDNGIVVDYRSFVAELDQT